MLVGKGACKEGSVKSRQNAIEQAISEAGQVAVNKKNGCFDGLTDRSKNVFN